MDPDVIEIPPPPPSLVFHRTNRGRKPTTTTTNSNKRLSAPKRGQVNLHEVIDLDEDEDFIDVMILDENVTVEKKGKAIVNDGNDFNQSKEIGHNHQSGLVENSASKSNNPINVDDVYWSHGIDVDDTDMSPDDFMYFNEYASLQAHLDDLDLPANVEAPVPWFPFGPSVEAQMPWFSPGPWFSAAPTPSVETPIPWSSSGHTGDSTNGSFTHEMSQAQWASNNSTLPTLADYKKSSTLGSSSSKNKLDSTSLVLGSDLSSKSSLLQSSWGVKLVGSGPVGISPNFPNFSNKEAYVASSGSSPHVLGNEYNSNPYNMFIKNSPMSVTSKSGVGDLNSHGSSSHLNSASGDLGSPDSHFGGVDHSTDLGPPISWVQSKLKSAISKFPTPSNLNGLHLILPDPPKKNVLRTPRIVDRDDVLRKLQLFKKFDSVEDYSDHHYKGSSSKNAQKNWAKKIQDEWKILENDLPENIYVRAYETRMDLLRAAIVGADGTPYHDGLFFFDIHLPPCYPNVPPRVHYHSGGLRLNPNLYGCGKVCLSLLGTWHGNANEQWLPGTSTVLQVLVSIQALILNQKPFFNEPGYESMMGTPDGEKRSEQYNESTYLLSLKTMTYALRKPPKHFEDFVLGHFHKRAHDILVACRSYIDGAQVGSLVKGGIQDVDEGSKSCSKSFKDNLPAHVDVLVQEFQLIGVKDCEKFWQVTKAANDSSANMPKKAAKKSKGWMESPSFKK